MSEDTGPFCLAPWAGIHSTPDGLVYPCCMSTFNPENSFGDLNKDTIENILNSDKAKAFRKTMLSNKPDLNACMHCVSEEKTGTSSFRKYWNRRFYKYTSQYLTNTNEEGFYNFDYFPYVDIRISSLCNFKCRMCHSALSSSWMLEDIKNGKGSVYNFDEKTGTIEIPQKEKLLTFIYKFAKYIEEIEFAGGEPFLIKEYFDIINEFLKVRNYNVKLRFHTNASTLHNKGKYIPDILKHFKNVTIMGSIDGYKEVNDYMRKGSHYFKIINNVTELKRKAPRVYFRLVPTISIPTIYSVPFLYIDFLKNKLIGYRDIACRPLYGPEYLNIQTLPIDEKLRIVTFYNYFIEKTINKLSKNFISKKLNQHNIEYIKKEFSSILNFMMSKHESVTFNYKGFRERIKELDLRRNETYETIFPETSHLITGNNTYNINNLYNKLNCFIDQL